MVRRRGGGGWFGKGRGGLSGLVAVASRCCASRSSPVSWRSARSAAVSSTSVEAVSVTVVLASAVSTPTVSATAASTPAAPDPGRPDRRVLLGESLPCPAPGLGERRGVGEQPLAEYLHREGSGAAARLRPLRYERAHRIPEGVERGGERGFARVEVEGQGPRRVAGAEAWGGAPRVDVAFQPADHHVLDAPAHGGAHLARAGEAHRVEHLQQAGEGAGVAVVRGGGEEQPVLELRRHQAQHPAQVAVFAEGRRHQVVAFVDDQQVPGQMRGALRGAAGGEEVLQHVGLAQVVEGGDDAAGRAPGVHVHAEPAAQALGLLPVHHLETERELVPKLLAPLPAQRRRGEDEHVPDAAPEQQLGEDESRLDGLAEAHSAQMVNSRIGVFSAVVTVPRRRMSNRIRYPCRERFPNALPNATYEPPPASTVRRRPCVRSRPMVVGLHETLAVRA